MREKIILAPSANGTDLLRSLARHGKKTFCLRVMSSAELAEAALMRSGETVTEQYIRIVDEPSLIFSFVKEVDFFSSASFADAQNIASALDSLRKLTVSDESAVILTPERGASVLGVHAPKEGANCLDIADFAPRRMSNYAHTTRHE